MQPASLTRRGKTSSWLRSWLERCMGRRKRKQTPLMHLRATDGAQTALAAPVLKGSAAAVEADKAGIGQQQSHQVEATCTSQTSQVP